MVHFPFCAKYQRWKTSVERPWVKVLSTQTQFEFPGERCFFSTEKCDDAETQHICTYWVFSKVSNSGTNLSLTNHRPRDRTTSSVVTCAHYRAAVQLAPRRPRCTYHGEFIERFKELHDELDGLRTDARVDEVDELSRLGHDVETLHVVRLLAQVILYTQQSTSTKFTWFLRDTNTHFVSSNLIDSRDSRTFFGCKKIQSSF